MEELFKLWWVKTGLYAALAAFGGWLGHIMRSLDRSDPINWVRATVEGLAAGFVGILVTLACNALGLNEQWTGVIVGVCGWLGANASIRLLEDVILKKLGIRRETPIQQEAVHVDSDE